MNPARLLKEAKLKRVEQHIIFKNLMEKHKGKIPIRALINHRGRQLEEL